MVRLGTPRQPALLTAPSRLMAYGGPSDDGCRWLESDDDRQDCPTCYGPMQHHDSPDGKHGVWRCACGQPELYGQGPVYLGPVKPRNRVWDEPTMKEAGSPLRVWQRTENTPPRTPPLKTPQQKATHTMTVFTPTAYTTYEPGVYQAVFKRTEEYTTKPQAGDPQQRIRWLFELLNDDTGEYEPFTGTTSTVFSPKSNAWGWVEGLLGRPIAKDDEIDTDDYRDMKCQLVLSVNETPTGIFNNIDRILPAKKKKGAPRPVVEDEAEEAF